MQQNKQFHRHSLCTVMSHVVLFAYRIMLSYKNSTKEVILWFPVIFAMQSREYWTKCRVTGTLTRRGTEKTRRDTEKSKTVSIVYSRALLQPTTNKFCWYRLVATQIKSIHTNLNFEGSFCFWKTQVFPAIVKRYLNKKNKISTFTRQVMIRKCCNQGCN